METEASIGFAWPKVGAAGRDRTYWDRPALNPEPEAGVVHQTETQQEDGYAVGLEEGRQAGAAEYDRQLNVLQATLAELESTRKEISSAAVKDAANVVQAMFTALFRAEMKTNPAVLEQLQKVASQSIDTESNKIRIGIAQDDYQRLSADVFERFGAELHAEQIAPGTVRVSAGSLVREIDLVGNLEQLIAAGLNESELE